MCVLFCISGMFRGCVGAFCLFVDGVVECLSAALQVRTLSGDPVQENRAGGGRSVNVSSLSAQASDTTEYDPVHPDSVNTALYECECLTS